MFGEEELLPLSGLQHLAFCERRWALIHLERQWEENLFTAEGEVIHEKAHSGDVESRPGALIRRTVPVRSYRLGISGQTDVLEYLPCRAGEAGVRLARREGVWRPYPVEYKRRRDRGGRSPYAVQLCAQAICLEEMLQTEVAEGAIFDAEKHRRVAVAFDSALRAMVEVLAGRMHEIHQSRATPRAEHGRRCESCSMKPVCLPRIGERTSASRYLRRALARHLDDGGIEHTQRIDEVP